MGRKGASKRKTSKSKDKANPGGSPKSASTVRVSDSPAVKAAL